MTDLLPPTYPTPPPFDRKQAKAQAAAYKAQAKAMRPWFRKKRFWLLGAVAIIVVASVAGAAGSKKSTTSTTSSGAAAAAPSSEVFSLGQTAHTGDFDVTLDTVTDPFTNTNQFLQPKDNQRYVAVELTVTNTADDQRALSTILNVEVTDSQARPWDVSFSGSFDTGLADLDGIVAKGEARRGWVVFAVGADSAGLKMRIKGDFTSTGSVFALS